MAIAHWWSVGVSFPQATLHQPYFIPWHTVVVIPVPSSWRTTRLGIHSVLVTRRQVKWLNLVWVERRKFLLGFSSSKRRRGSVLPPLTTTGMHTSGKRVDTENGIREAVNSWRSRMRIPTGLKFRSRIWNGNVGKRVILAIENSWTDSLCHEGGPEQQGTHRVASHWLVHSACIVVSHGTKLKLDR